MSLYKRSRSFYSTLFLLKLFIYDLFPLLSSYLIYFHPLLYRLFKVQYLFSVCWLQVDIGVQERGEGGAGGPFFFYKNLIKSISFEMLLKKRQSATLSEQSKLVLAFVSNIPFPFPLLLWHHLRCGKWIEKLSCLIGRSRPLQTAMPSFPSQVLTHETVISD